MKMKLFLAAKQVSNQGVKPITNLKEETFGGA